MEIAMKRLLVTCTAALLSTFAFANAGEDKAPNRPCKADMEKLCPDVHPGRGRISACMKEHKDQLSDGCKANLKNMRAHRAGADGDTAGDKGDDSN
jgi:hypothetical protein